LNYFLSAKRPILSLMLNAKYLTVFLTLVTLVAFAANSILARMALMSLSIGALEFTLVRLLSGISILLPILLLSKVSNRSTSKNTKKNILAFKRSNIVPALALFVYAVFFSLAYIQLDAGTGALILFAAVQSTMLGVSIYRGNRLTQVEWLGFALSLGGLVYLLFPGLSAPPLFGATMMLVSGISWGAYSLLGQTEDSPILSTARNFLFCAPGCVLLLIIIVIRSENSQYALSSNGIFLAALSGAVTSGLGYVLWYVTLRRITTTVASISQLAVPVIAGLGGIIFLSESMSLRLALASIMIIGGIVATVLGKGKT